jgi:tryptophanyl-tRNA synthetase
MVQFIAPIRERAEAIYADKTYIRNVIASGAEKARVNAKKTIDTAREMMGLVY